ncbi:MAG TPA: sodium:solute symporter family protein [Bacillota bacterium]|nr:sodium:solute symporter family protein [Bacillota bacterium]
MVNFTQLWSGLDWGVILLYFGAVVVIGLAMRRRASRDMKSFFVASRRLTIPVMIGVAAAGWYDSWTIVGLAECGATMGIAIIFVYVFPTIILRLPLALWIGPLVRNRIPDWVITFPDLFEYLYDRKTKLALAISMMPVYIYEAALVTAAGQVLSFVTGINIWILFIIIVAVTIFYTSLAGMWGLAVTDMMQFVIMGLGAGFLIFGTYHYYDGFGNLFSQVGEYNPDFLTPTGGMGFAGVMGWVISTLAMYANSQCYQRFGASKSGGDIAVSYSLMLGFGGLFSCVMVFAGMGGLIAFPDAASHGESFWAFAFTVLPIGLRGLFVAALLAAVMSTVSADFLIAATVVMSNIIRDFIAPSLTERQNVIGTKIVLWIMGILTVLGTMFFQEGIDKAYYYVGGFQVAVFFVPLIVGLFYKKRTGAGGFWTLVIATIFYGVWQFGLGIPFGIPTNLATIVVGFIVYIAISNATYKGNRIESNKSV